MDYFSLPFLIIPAVLLFAALMFLFRSVKRKATLSKLNSDMIIIPFSRENISGVKKIISSVNFPVVADIAMAHIGKAPNIYLSSMKKDFPKIKKVADNLFPGGYGIEEEDYSVFHHGGFHEALSCEMERSEAAEFDFSSMDFSKVNEIGEGAAIKMAIIPGKKVNIRMIFSAPSQFQLREIVNSVAAPFKGRGCRAPKNKDIAVKDFNSPDFIRRAVK